MKSACGHVGVISLAAVGMNDLRYRSFLRCGCSSLLLEYVVDLMPFGTPARVHR